MKITAVFFNKQKKDILDRSNILNNLDNISKIKNKRDYLKLNNKIDMLDKLNILKKVSVKEIIIFSILLFFITTIFSNFDFNIKSNILKISTNIYENKSFKLPYEYVKNIYPVFNDTSYIFKDVISNIDVTDNNKDELNKNDNEGSIKEEIGFNDITKEINTPDIFNKIENPSITQTQMSNRKEVKINNIVINNYSNHLNLDYKELINSKLYFTKASDKLLFYHTHTSESYSNSEKYKFEYSSTYRSRDEKFNMLSVGKLLTKLLKDKKINSVHNTNEHDYYTYTTSYTKSRNTLKTELSKNSYSIIFDLHRDAIADLTYAPKVNIEGKEVAQLMFVVGVGSKSYPNKYAKDNLSFAIKFQLLAESIYPGLFKPMMIKDYTYNQDMNKYSVLIECGATGNTFEQVYLSMELLSNLFEFMYVD